MSQGFQEQGIETLEGFLFYASHPYYFWRVGFSFSLSLLLSLPLTLSTTDQYFNVSTVKYEHVNFQPHLDSGVSQEKKNLIGLLSSMCTQSSML